MSDRVTTQTEMKGAKLVATAMQAAGIEFTTAKTNVAFGTAVLNVKTGRLTYPVDAVPEKLGLLRQLYAEAKYRAEVEQLGGIVESRTVDKDGHVTLMCSMGEAPKRPKTRSSRSL